MYDDILSMIKDMIKSDRSGRRISKFHDDDAATVLYDDNHYDYNHVGDDDNDG